MKYAKPANFSTLMDDIADACARVWRGLGRAAKTIAAQPWPVLLVASVLLAFALTIVPLALFLFIVFLVLKFVVAAFVIDSRRNRGD
jgi:hypothetical protein